MKARNFFLIAIVIIFSICSLSSAQTGRRLLTKAQFDSVKVELNALPDSNPMKRYAAFFHDLTLDDGHNEYVSMKGKVVKELKNSVNNVAAYATNLKKSVDNIQIVIAGDETPVEVKEEITYTVPAKELALEQIKKSVAALRAQQAQQK